MEDEAKHEAETSRNLLDAITCFVQVARAQGRNIQHSHPRLRARFPAPQFITHEVQRKALEWLRDGITRPGPPSSKLMAAACVLAAVPNKFADEALLYIDPELQVAMADLVCSDVLPVRVTHRIFLSFRDHGRECFWGMHLTRALHRSPKLNHKYEQLKARYKSAENGMRLWILRRAMSL